MFFKDQKSFGVAVSLILVFVIVGHEVTPVQAGTVNYQSGTVYRVTTNGVTTSPCGTDWSNPCDLQYALSIATSGAEIWVASGTYYPDQGSGQTENERESTFSLKNGVAVYGGFSGTETMLSQRNSDPSQNGTVLSGDIGTKGSIADNAHHVVKANNLSSSTILDGFTISGGNADGGTENFGGGLYSDEGSPTLRNIIFTGNISNSGGGGMFAISQRTLRAEYSTPILINVIFNGNTAVRGGGLYTQNSSPALTNVIFSGNIATGGSGGGMSNWTLHMVTDEYSLPTLTNVTFTGNTAVGGGGLFNSNSHPVLTNVTFSGNTASFRGGAIYNEGASLTLRNVTISSNTAPAETGGAIRNVTFSLIPSNLIIENSILWGDADEEILSDGTSSITLVDSVIQGGCPTGAVCTNVISTDPVLAGLANNGGFTQTRALRNGSSAINAGGVNSTCASDDQRGAARPQGDSCDIGALEAYLLTVTADSKTITFGDAEPEFSFQYDGWLNGDTSAVIDTPPTCGVSGAHTNANTYVITCSGGVDNKYVFFAYVNGTLTIHKATPTLSVTNSPVTYNGSPRAAAVTGSVPGTVSNILTGGSVTQTNANTYTVTANFIPTDIQNYNSLVNASAGNFVINKATPTLSVTNSPIIYDGSFHGATVSSSVPGVIDNILTGGSATQKNANTYAVTADFTPSDTSNYKSLTGASAGNFIINKATPTLSVTNSPITYDGLFHAAAVEGSVPGTVSNVITGGSASKKNAGTYAVTANFTPTDTTNYNSLTGVSAGNFIINKATPVLSVTHSPVIYNGSPRAATVTGSVLGTVSNTLTGGSATQTNAGTYAVTANFTPTDTANYITLTSASAGNFIINKATPTLSVTNSPALYNGFPQTATVSSSVPGTVSNILMSGAATQTDLGTYVTTANFIPTDSTNYNSLVNASAGNFVISTDITAPGTQILLHPLSPSGRDVNFTFSSEDGTAVFECQMDGGGFSSCASPKSYWGLGDGSHVFMVRARDLVDNMDPTPASYTWVVAGKQTKVMVSGIVAPFSITTQGGLADGSILRLWFLEQMEADNTPETYVNFQTPGGVYYDYRSFFIPEDIQMNLISNTLLQVNFNGPASSTQTWTWSIYDWKTDLWIKLGNTIGSTAGHWNSMTFPVRSIERYVSPRREVRIQLRSNNANGDLKVDYEALHLTYRSMTVPLVPSAPLVPILRPGIASTSGQWKVR